MIVYFNGELMPQTEAKVPMTDRGLLYGLGFFETFRTAGGRPHLWPYHVARLERACARAGLALPANFLARDTARRDAVLRQLLQQNGHADAVFRYTVTAGAAEDDSVPTEMLVPRPLPAECPPSGVVLRALQLERDGGEWLPRPKSLNYANALLGRHELQRRAAELSDEGLFLSRGSEWVVETTHQALAWIEAGQVRYPDPGVGAVESTALGWLLARGGPSKACHARLADLARAEAIFALNAVRGITPVRALYDRTDAVLVSAIPSAVHPVVVSLRQQWREALEQTASS